MDDDVNYQYVVSSPTLLYTEMNGHNDTCGQPYREFSHKNNTEPSARLSPLFPIIPQAGTSFQIIYITIH